MNDDRVYILDVYNRGIYPQDEFAKSMPDFPFDSVNLLIFSGAFGVENCLLKLTDGSRILCKTSRITGLTCKWTWSESTFCPSPQRVSQGRLRLDDYTEDNVYLEKVHTYVALILIMKSALVSISFSIKPHTHHLTNQILKTVGCNLMDKILNPAAAQTVQLFSSDSPHPQQRSVHFCHMPDLAGSLCWILSNFLDRRRAELNFCLNFVVWPCWIQVVWS